MTIARFVANQHGLGGKNILAQAQADMVVDCVSDFFNLGIYGLNRALTTILGRRSVIKAT
jgi:hypothetical protein